MTGTIVCGVTDSPDGRAAAQLAGALGRRLGLRLVLVHVLNGVHECTEEVTRALEAIAREFVHAADVELRVEVGGRAERLARIAAEEGADLIVLGSRPHGLSGRLLSGTLARDLEAATPVPVLVAPPQTRRRTEQRLAFVETSATR